jgi:hypothetical protein
MINAIRKKNNQTPFKRNGNQATASSKVVCRFCKKIGHWQKYCRTRIRDNKPCIDENGKPYENQPKVTGIEQAKDQENSFDFNQGITSIGHNSLNY